ncbi:MAG: ankyrin repeat domain-containing protein [Tepidisphaeraceae bacterium]
MKSDANDELVNRFLDAAVPRPDSHHKGGLLAPALEMLAAHPRLAASSFLAACVLGDVVEVARQLGTDALPAVTPGGPRGWAPLVYLCFSRFLRDQKDRAGDFVRCAELLMDRGADPNSSFPATHDGNYPERCLYGAAGVANCAPLAQILLDAGADVNDDESLYHASEFADNAALRVLLRAKPRPDWVSYNMCHKMDMEDPAGLKLFIDHDGDANFLIDRGLFNSYCPLHFAVFRRRSRACFELLLDAGADPNLAGSDGVTPYQLARKLGLNEIAELFLSRGARDDLDDRTRFLAVLSSANERTARAMLDRDPSLRTGLTDRDHRLLVDATESGNVNAVRLMLDLGFPLETRQTTCGGWDATALHHAAWHGQADVVRLLLDRGADPKLKHSFGGDALSAAIHGANHAGHDRGPQVVELIARAYKPEELDHSIAYADSEANTDVQQVLRNVKEQQKG